MTDHDRKILYYTALTTVNAPRPRKMTVEDLRQALSDQDIAKRWKSHLCAFFEEVSPASAEQIIKAERLDPAALLALVPMLQPRANAVESMLKEMIF